VVPDLVAALREAKERGSQLVGLEITDESKPLAQLSVFREQGAPLVLVVGAERTGISAGVLAGLDACVHIEMYGRNSSLNVATALGVALYEWNR
jgi:tRNA G18 (ribose-2'-O)-methylase SpoU